MKKRALLSVLFLILILPFTIAADDSISVSGTDENSKIDKAYNCLNGKVNESCSSSLEDNIFVLLAINKCNAQVISASKNSSECWPSSGCKIKQTAQAILALKNAGSSTEKAESWLIARNMTPTNLEWYLEIESSNATTCKVKYSGSEYTISIGEDKKINTNAGSCLALSEGAWWLKVSPSCYSKDFEISCDKDFITSLIYKKGTSSTIYISEEANSASSGGTVNEKINSLCFTDGSGCNYEGTLWAALALSVTGHDTSFYIPYLSSESSENKKYIPYSFLYTITASSDYRNSLLLNQKNNYWDESGDKFYDTALALYSLKYEDPVEKSNAKQWLLDSRIQGSDGCWGGSIKNTAFILHSVWPRTIYSSAVSEDDCEDMEYYCMSRANCEEARGSELDYACSSPNICCSQEEILDSCSEQGGEICTSDEICSGTFVDASDADSGEECCIGGSCEEESVEVADCESHEGDCRITQCEDNEEESYTYSCDSNYICCVEKISEDKWWDQWWIWLLLILIILLILAIIFRDRLRVYWNKFGNKNSKSSGPPGSFGGQSIPMVSPGPFMQQPIQRRIFHPQQRYPVRRPLPKKSSEVDEVLKKLKEIGK